MIKVTFGEGETYTRIYGLYQWDYGQTLCIAGAGNLNRTEVHFALEGCDKALIQPAVITDGIICAAIPNKMLETGRNIKAYVYVADSQQGKTVRTALLLVEPRSKPDDYDTPAEKNLLREILEELDTKADDMKLKEGELQLLAKEKPIGQKIRLPTGGTGTTGSITIPEIDEMMKGD